MYQDALSWLENAEREYAQREFRAIIATENPRRNPVVVLGDDLGLSKARLWTCDLGAMPSRSTALDFGQFSNGKMCEMPANPR